MWTPVNRILFQFCSTPIQIWSGWAMPKIATLYSACLKMCGPRWTESSWVAAGKLPHFRSGLVRDISRWQENRISPIPRLNICHRPPSYSLTSPPAVMVNALQSKDIITSPTDWNNGLTWKSLCWVKRVQDWWICRDCTFGTLGRCGWEALHGTSSFTITITIL